MHDKYHAEAQRRREAKRARNGVSFFPLCASAPLREILGLLIVFAAPRIGDAQTLLRWKLKAGDALAVEIEQHTDAQVSFSAKTAITKIDLTLHLGWKVMAAEEAGFRIRQTVDRIQQKITTRDAGTVEYDSSASERRTGQA